MKKLIVAVTSTLLVTSAFAWGPREQGALLGLGIGWIVGNQQNQSQQVPPTVIYTPPHQQQLICGVNVYCIPTPQCTQELLYDQWGRVVAERKVCR